MQITFTRAALITITLLAFIGMSSLTLASEKERSEKRHYTGKQDHSSNRDKHPNKGGGHQNRGSQRHGGAVQGGHGNRQHSGGYGHRARSHGGGHASRVGYGHGYRYGHQAQYGHGYGYNYGYPHAPAHGYYGSAVYVSPLIGINLHLD